MRKVTVLAAAFALATAAFVVTMLTTPPVSHAQPNRGIDTYALTLSAAPTVPTAYDDN